MTYRRIQFSALPKWQNPLKSLRKKPFLEDIAFPVSADEPPQPTDAVHPYSLLRRYYVKQRINGPVDLNELRDFLIGQPSGIYVIKGDVGVGKTWFLRYLVNFALKEELGFQIASGIIDMWQRKYPEALENAHWQLDAILTRIVDLSVGLREALRPEAERRARAITGESATDSRRFADEVDEYFRSIEALQNRIERNLLRLGYLESKRVPILLGVDNMDRYSDREQDELFGLMVKLLRYPNVHLIVPVRPSTYFATRRCLGAGEFYYREMELQKLDYAATLRLRFETAADGSPLRNELVTLRESDFTARRDDADPATDPASHTEDDRQVVTCFPDILEIFLRGYGFALLDSLADTDVRHALKFVTRVLFSDNLLAISNLENGYFFISAAMLRRSRDFRADESYILNLFDDDHPDRPGNALIRFRVLEYFINGRRRIGEDYFFKNYFERLGYDTDWVGAVLVLFVESGLLKSVDGREGSLNEVDELITTRQGELYFHTLIRNRWYLYCIKRGMAINEVYITKRRVRRYVWREEVEDDQLVQFFREEEELEATRAKDWADSVGESEGKYGELLEVSELVHAGLRLPA